MACPSDEKRRRIPHRRARPSRAIPTVLVAVAALGSCAPQPWNGVRRTRADQQLAAHDAELARHRAALDGRRRAIEELRREQDDLELRVREERGTRTELARELEREIARVQAMEEDLTAARVRQKAIEAELAGVRGLEEQLAAREQRLA